MAEIILSFFAVIGICYLLMRVFDYFFYRKAFFNTPIIMDLRSATREEAINLFELFCTVRHRECGKAILNTIICVIGEKSEIKEEDALRYMRVFDIDAILYTEEEYQLWKAKT